MTTRSSKAKLEIAPTEENPRRRRRRRRRNPDEGADVEANPRRRRRRRSRRRNNPRRKNMKGSTVALIAVGALVGVPLLVVGGMALMGKSLLKKAQTPVIIPAQTVY